MIVSISAVYAALVVLITLPLVAWHTAVLAKLVDTRSQHKRKHEPQPVQPSQSQSKTKPAMGSTVLLIVLVELLGGSAWLIHSLGIALLVGVGLETIGQMLTVQKFAKTWKIDGEVQPGPNLVSIGLEVLGAFLILGAMIAAAVSILALRFS